MQMRAVDVRSNIKNWSAYDYKAYRLDKGEADCCTNALDNYIWHNVEKEGMPTEPGRYLYKVNLYDNGYSYWSGHVQDNGIEAIVVNNEDANFEYTITHWRKIIDNDNAYMEG